jgi:hypothetical protein
MTRARATYVVAVTLSLALPLLSKPTVTLSQTEVPPVTVGYKSGHVNEVRSTSIEIDERSYELKSDVVILDHEGNPLELDRILPTSLVKFHLKEGHVDKMVVTLPQ